MTDHDALCPQRHQYRGHKSRCVCALLAAARADERARWGLGWVAAADNVAALAHAEAVAARLVGAFCSEVEDVEGLHRIIGELDRAHDLACEQRDAARAEVESLREQYDLPMTEDGRYGSPHHSHATPALAKVCTVCRAYAATRSAVRREVLADLRAKVEALHHDGLCSVTAQMASCDCLRGDVLALIDGAR